ncbi:MAG: hypothetical protein RLZZ330_749 [Actinomycetota bacterium]|jgi:methylated-DNA-[protein]-cysteine S-methyltransferase
MQSWFVESKILGLIRVSLDENRIGFTRSGKSIEGAIVSLDMLVKGKPSVSMSRQAKTFNNQLAHYEAGDLDAFNNLSVAYQGSDFRRKVLHQMRQIPVGSVETYGGLASLSGNPKAFRAVATVCATNLVPLVLPCHRVVPSDFSIGNYASRKLKNGSNLKELLLTHEDALI